MIHIYTGDGKGKTSAALGLALRFAGYGNNVLIVQFGKGSYTGELSSLSYIPNIKVLRNSRDFGFWPSISDSDINALLLENNTNFKAAINEINNKNCSLIILDELTSAYEYGTVDRSIVDLFLRQQPPQADVVITGRNAGKLFLDVADYISEIKNVRHPFDRGEKAREGIEY